jgi:hypothetical protein
MAKKAKAKKKASGGDATEALKKHAFWIEIGILSLAAIVIWFIATSGLKSQYQAERNKISAMLSSVQGAQVEQPNETSISVLTEEMQKRREFVNENWRKAYEEQRKYLIWPEEFSEGFRSVFDQALSPERLEFPAGNVLDPTFGNEYRNYARRQVAAICETMQADYMLDRSARSSDNKADAAEIDSIVYWERKDQEQAQQSLQFDSAKVLTKQDVLYAQECVWVYQALAEMIRNTNADKNPAGNYDAAIKTANLSIGEDYQQRGDAGILYIQPNKDDERGPGGERSRRRDKDDKEEVPRALEPASKRYVDQFGRLLFNQPAAEVIKLQDPATEYKRMPVYMKLTVDLRYLDRFLAHCNNHPLTLEVREVFYDFDRVSRLKEGAKKSGSEELSLTNNTYFDVEVTIHGMMYLFYAPPSSPAADEEGAVVDEESAAAE